MILFRGSSDVSWELRHATFIDIHRNRWIRRNTDPLVYQRMLELFFPKKNQIKFAVFIVRVRLRSRGSFSLSKEAPVCLCRWKMRFTKIRFFSAKSHFGIGTPRSTYFGRLPKSHSVVFVSTCTFFVNRAVFYKEFYFFGKKKIFDQIPKANFREKFWSQPK